MNSRIDQIIEHESAAENLEIKAADDHKWEAARLIAEELAAGNTLGKLAKAIRKTKTHVFQMSKCWKLRVHLSERSFNQFYNSELIRGPTIGPPKKRSEPKPKTQQPSFPNGAVIERADDAIIKLKLRRKEFNILQRAINPECRAGEEANAALMFIRSLKQRYPVIKEIPQLY